MTNHIQLKPFLLLCAGALLALVVGRTLMNVGQAAQAAQAAPGSGAASSAKMAAPLLFPNARRGAVVDAANAFLATLSPAQRTTTQIAFSPQNAGRWSNFPTEFVPRNGVFFRDLNAKQVAAALRVARLALSDQGFKRFQEVRATDDYFAKHDTGPGPGGGGRGGNRGGPGGPGGPPPGDFGGDGGPNGGPGDFGGPRGGGPGGFGGGGNLFGQSNYIIAFLGTPSKNAPWLLQLGSHHLAFNIFYAGKVGTATPYFVGAQPNV